MWFKYGLKVHKRVCHKSTVRQRLKRVRQLRKTVRQRHQRVRLLGKTVRQRHQRVRQRKERNSPRSQAKKKSS